MVREGRNEDWPSKWERSDRNVSENWGGGGVGDMGRLYWAGGPFIGAVARIRKKTLVSGVSDTADTNKTG